MQRGPVDLEFLTDSLGDDQQGMALVFEEVTLFGHIAPEDVDAAFAAQEASS